jgi:hypothetical protein
MHIDVVQLDSFCTRWLRKAKSHDGPYSREHIGSRIPKYSANTRSGTLNLAHSFDRFTSLYVAFSRVYTEVGKLLIAKGQVRPPRLGRYAPPPDRKTATSYVVDFYGLRTLQTEIQADEPCRTAVDALVDLIGNGHFYRHEDYETGAPDLSRDQRIARRAAQYDPKAILELIYQARCNLFHGTKVFEERQRILLDNMSTIVEFATRRILIRLKAELREV